MTPCRRGEVFLVRFDYTDRSGAKLRPAVVVSSDDYHRVTPDVVVASITGNRGAIRHPGDVELDDWRQAGLVRPSLAQTKLATIEAAGIGRRLGRLSASDLASLDRGLRQALAL